MCCVAPGGQLYVGELLNIAGWHQIYSCNRKVGEQGWLFCAWAVGSVVETAGGPAGKVQRENWPGAVREAAVPGLQVAGRVPCGNEGLESWWGHTKAV